MDVWSIADRIDPIVFAFAGGALVLGFGLTAARGLRRKVAHRGVGETYVTKKRTACSGRDLDEFIALVNAGGAIQSDVRARLQLVDTIIFCRLGRRLIGVSALKRPTTYRDTLRVRSGFYASEASYPFELGYISVDPAYRGNGIGRQLIVRAIKASRGAGVYATTNHPSVATQLSEAGFQPKGRPWVGSRGGEPLRLYALPARP